MTAATTVTAVTGDRPDSYAVSSQACYTGDLRKEFEQDPARAEAWVAALNSDETLGWPGALKTEDLRAYTVSLTLVVLLADTQDNPGVGGSADTTGLLRAMLDERAERAVLGVLHDPDAALAAHQAGVGHDITIGLGAKSGGYGEHYAASCEQGKMRLFSYRTGADHAQPRITISAVV